MARTDLDRRVQAVRGFNRFYTRKIGVLQQHLLRSPFSLAEARVLYELAHRERPTATELCAALALDAGYVSRILRGLQRRGLLQRERSADDGRERLLRLTERGRDAFAGLDAASQQEVGAMLLEVPEEGQRRVVGAMQAIARWLGDSDDAAPSYVLRPHQAGDMGWVVERHGALYAQEYGWDEQFEALVAEIVGGFLRRYDPKRERCWIAERDGERVGCVFLVQRSKTVAQLRLLLVEPSARGLGIGTRLVDECVRFARQARYRKIVLWTNDVLHAARRIYERAGFHLVEEEPHHSFGHDLVGQTWEMKL